MAINEVIKNSAYRVWNELEGVWKKYALWTTGSQVECADGYTVEDKIGDIKGITTSTNVTETGYAADASMVNTMINASETRARIRSSTNSSIERSLLQGEVNTSDNPTISFRHLLAGSSLSNDAMELYFDGTNFYAVGRKGGADSVTKKLGSVVSTVIGTGGAGTYSATAIDGYKDLTVDNFAFIPTSVTGSFSGTATYSGGNNGGSAENQSTSGSATASPTISYNSSTGKVTIGSTSQSGSASNKTGSNGMLTAKSSGSVNVTGKIVCYHN